MNLSWIQSWARGKQWRPWTRRQGKGGVVLTMMMMKILGAASLTSKASFSMQCMYRVSTLSLGFESQGHVAADKVLLRLKPDSELVLAMYQCS